MSYWTHLKKQLKDPGYYVSLVIAFTLLILLWLFFPILGLTFMLSVATFMQILFMFAKAFSKYLEEKNTKERIRRQLEQMVK